MKSRAWSDPQKLRAFFLKQSLFRLGGHVRVFEESLRKRKDGLVQSDYRP
jgi:hypothetical protein